MLVGIKPSLLILLWLLDEWQKWTVTLNNKVNLLTLVNNISKHALRMNNTSTAFINLS